MLLFLFAKYNFLNNSDTKGFDINYPSDFSLFERTAKTRRARIKNSIFFFLFLRVLSAFAVHLILLQIRKKPAFWAHERKSYLNKLTHWSRSHAANSNHRRHWRSAPVVLNIARPQTAASNSASLIENSTAQIQHFNLAAEYSTVIDRAKLLENGIIPLSDFVNALQSLSRRCWIEQQGSSYTLPPVIREYIKGL